MILGRHVESMIASEDRLSVYIPAAVLPKAQVYSVDIGLRIIRTCDENRIEFNPVGEAGNYISLDQVLMLAFQHARNNREIYGKFANVELVWALDRAHETGDFYDVRLSYRPAHEFRGRPGVEQFIIPKMGGVEFRQIISEPRPI